MKKVQLMLTNPCSKKWDDLQQADEGRYCDRCEKNIVDLTSKSDAELIQFFKHKKDNVCGRLLSTQLHRELIQPPQKASWHWAIPLAMGAIAISTPVQAIELKPVIMQSDQGTALPVSSADKAMKTTVKTTLKGVVLDIASNKPLAGVKVRQEGFENVMAITDQSGAFELNLEALDTNLSFFFELPGYSTVASKLTEGMVVKLKPIASIRLGGISSINSNREPFYLVYAGKKSCGMDAAKLKEIPPEWIEKIEIQKGVAATALYGAKALNGVVLIGIKKAYAKKIDFSKKK